MMRLLNFDLMTQQRSLKAPDTMGTPWESRLGPNLDFGGHQLNLQFCPKRGSVEGAELSHECDRLVRSFSLKGHQQSCKMMHDKMVHHAGSHFSKLVKFGHFCRAGPGLNRSIWRDRATAQSHNVRCPDAWCHSKAMPQSFQNPL